MALISYYEHAFDPIDGKGIYKANVVKGILDVITDNRIRLDNRPDCRNIKMRLLRAKCGVEDGPTEFDIALGPVAYNQSLEFGAHDHLSGIIKLYLSQGVKEAFGYTLTEFLYLSDAETEVVLSAARKRLTDKNKAMSDLTSGFDIDSLRGDSSG